MEKLEKNGQSEKNYNGLKKAFKPAMFLLLLGSIYATKDDFARLHKLYMQNHLEKSSKQVREAKIVVVYPKYSQDRSEYVITGTYTQVNNYIGQIISYGNVLVESLKLQYKGKVVCTPETKEDELCNFNRDLKVSYVPKDQKNPPKITSKNLQPKITILPPNDQFILPNSEFDPKLKFKDESFLQDLENSQKKPSFYDSDTF